ncbi:hypothetical protein BDN70DRAFT_920557 [Pholiota conissans]|uniref:PHD-type domain-containing protein n=1 Tax=Pholiota conissans TaxID=109636 RepID=A0A9P5Z5H3_9AGAR|nr:hypothetical protein BDN70DRAFT_920557 [Pholiota conissans]
MHNTTPGVYPTAATSSATLNSILTTTASPRTQHQPHLPGSSINIHNNNNNSSSAIDNIEGGGSGRKGSGQGSTIPAKRKIRDVSPGTTDGVGYGEYSPTPHLPSLLSPSPYPYTSHSPAPRNQRRNSTASTSNPRGSTSNATQRQPTATTSTTLRTPPPPADTEAIDCICGFNTDDGFSIACDRCSRWCHYACFCIPPGGPVPELFVCWVCSPLPTELKERAVMMQRERLRAIRGGLPLGGSAGGTNGIGAGLDSWGLGGDDGGKRGRRVSPDVLQ